MATNKGVKSSRVKQSKTTNKRKSTRRTKADKIKIASAILDLYSSGEFTLESCCGEHGITARTLHNWSGDISEISDRYKKAKEDNAKSNKEKVRDLAIDGLKRLLTGYVAEEEDVEERFDKSGRLLSRIVKKKKKHVQPNTAAVIFALKNVDPANWNEDKFADEGQGEQVFKIGDQIVKF